MKTIVRMKSGSHLYGTTTPESDIDYRAVHIPNATDILMQRVADTVGGGRVKADGEKNQPGELDEKSYSIQAFLKLLSEGQTEALDMLFAPDQAILTTTPEWKVIQAYKDRLLTKKSAAFLGYCRKQAAKYGTKGARVEAAKKAAEFFAKALENFGPTARVGDALGMELYGKFDDHTRTEVVETTPSRFETFFVCCDRMVGFNNTVKEAAAMYKRVYDEYGARARAAATNQGIDWKAVSHAVRVGHEALELLTTHKITFPLPNAAHIVDIKLGKIPYATVGEEIEELLVRVEEASEKSTLPDTADKQWIDQFVYECHLEAVIGVVKAFLE